MSSDEEIDGTAEPRQIKPMRLWSDEDKLLLVYRAKNYPVLWDVRSAHYREVNLRKTALAELCAQFENRFTVEEINSKFRDMKDIFYRKKMEYDERISLGEVPPKPNWKYFKPLNYLLLCEEKRTSNLKRRVNYQTNSDLRRSRLKPAYRPIINSLNSNRNILFSAKDLTMLDTFCPPSSDEDESSNRNFEEEQMQTEQSNLQQQENNNPPAPPPRTRSARKQQFNTPTTPISRVDGRPSSSKTNNIVDSVKIKQEIPDNFDVKTEPEDLEFGDLNREKSTTNAEKVFTPITASPRNLSGVSRPITTARQQSAPYIIRKLTSNATNPNNSLQRRSIRIVTPQGNVVTQLNRQPSSLMTEQSQITAMAENNSDEGPLKIPASSNTTKLPTERTNGGGIRAKYNESQQQRRETEDSNAATIVEAINLEPENEIDADAYQKFKKFGIHVQNSVLELQNQNPILANNLLRSIYNSIGKFQMMVINSQR